MATLDERRAALSPQKQALFDRMLAARSRTDVFPVSVLQRGLWFLEQVRPDNPAHVVPGAVRVRGRLDVDVLRAAVDEIVRRQEALRTTFALRGGKPVQLVHAAMTVELPEADLRGRRLADSELDQAVASELGRPFDITDGPLLRLQLLRIADEEYVLVVAMHHLVSDRWSTGVFLTELSALYEACLDKKPSPLAQLPVQYGDFAVWQQQRLESGQWAQGLAYWRERLAGAPPVLDLPTDRPRPSVQGFDGGSVPLTLPQPLMAELGQLARTHGATTYMALLAAFNVLLLRYSSTTDLVVGVPTAIRDNVEVEPLIGYFVNTLPIRSDLSGNPDFTEVLKRVRDACLGAYQHQEVPFDLVVAELNTERDLSRPPVYQVSFSYGREPVPDFAMGGAELTRLTVRSAGSRFDLELQAFDNGDGLSGWFDYDRALFDEPTIARMAGHFRNLVQQAVAAPQKPVAELELLDDAERQRIVAGFNATERTWPGHGLIHECFEAQARRAPGADAVRFLGEAVSYAELNRRANRLARRLQRLGVGQGVLVAVAMERSVELVVSLLAVLKAGGAYVPLDPDYPPARLEFMVRDADAPVLLTQRSVLGTLPEVTAEVLCVDDLAGDLADGPGGDDLGVPVDGEDLAYVIYTSGSTGQPKGVQNVHAGIRNRLLWMQDTYQLDGTDRVLQKTPISFDVSVWEFFWPLLAGASIVLARPGGHRDSAYLTGLIRAEQVTTLHFVPAMLQTFLTEQVEDCTSLRRVICSGEELPRDLQDRFLSRSQAQLHNLYGPTEAAIDVTAWACRNDGDDRPVPIGRPIANTQIYVLDTTGRPVPTGVPGELHIGGRNLARGYLNRPELTAQRFVDDPLHPGTGRRLYRTGDLARFRDDGAVEFLGRLDHQVKLRGFRIELGEIEAALARHDEVREAVVRTHEYAAGDHRLVAYLTTTADKDVDTGALAAHVRRWLPEYMVPAAFVVLPAFPLSPSGKVDRAALPAPDSARPELQTLFVAPQAGLEDTIARLWQQALGVERVGVQDNFFDLGGHSLLMAEIRAQLAALDHDVSMVELFQYPTVRSLAQFLQTRDTTQAQPLLAAEERAENRRQRRDRRQNSADRRARSRTEG